MENTSRAIKKSKDLWLIILVAIALSVLIGGQSKRDLARETTEKSTALKGVQIP